MPWLQNLDVALFRFINQTLSNPLFDAVMPWMSGNRLFLPLTLLVAAGLIWRGRGMATLFLLLLALALAVTDGLVSTPLKQAIGRVRPCGALEQVHLLVGCTGSGSMPSNHSANWFAATIVAFIFHQRSVWLMLPLAMVISFSRVYNGVHYPSDVLAGAILGSGAGLAVVFALNTVWRRGGQKWFPLWYERLPSPVPVVVRQSGAAGTIKTSPHASHSELNKHWLRAGYLVAHAKFKFPRTGL